MIAGARVLEGRRGLVVGVSGPNSVGYRAASGLRELGAEVTMTARAPRIAALHPLASRLGCDVVELDANDERSVERAMHEAGERRGRIDFLLHTLVRVPDGALSRPVYEISKDDFAEVMEISVRSLLVCVRHSLRWLERSDCARIVTLLSTGSDCAVPNYHAVGIAKGALCAAVRYLAAELGPRGILCNGIHFSILATDAANHSIGAEETEKTRQYLAKRSMTRRPLDFDDVVSAVAFLSSPLCRNITGELLTVDGGFTHSYF